MPLYRQAIPEIILVLFFELVFVTRDLQNDMFCHLAESARGFPVGLDPHIVEKEKEYLYYYSIIQKEIQRKKSYRADKEEREGA